MFNVDELKEKIAKKIAEAGDEAVPDGVIQKTVGLVISELGQTLAAAGLELAGAQNADGDK